MAGTLRIPGIALSPVEDAERLRKSFQGLGTDEDGVIWVLGHRNASQIKEIREAYENLYNETLLDRINSELSGDFRNAVMLWTYDPVERDAKLAQDALKNHRRGIKHLQVLVEVSCARPPQHLVAVRKAYCLLFACSLEEDIASAIALPLRKVLVGLVSSFRCDKELVDLDVARTEAAFLNEAIISQRLDHDVVIYILSTRNSHQLRATFECYEANFGNPIEEDILSCGKGDLESLLKTIIWCLAKPAKHFAEVIKSSIVGLGTDEDSLNRAIVTRADVDMMTIREEYNMMYNTTVESDVQGDTSGDYERFLLTLLGARF